MLAAKSSQLLARQVSARFGVCVARSAEYLNWCYRAHFHHRHEILIASRKGALFGYTVFIDKGDFAEIVDLFGMDDPGVMTDLVCEAVSILRERGVYGVNAPLLRSRRWSRFFRSLGFYIREAHPVIVCTPSGNPGGSSILEGLSWFLMNGDRDS